MNDLFCLRDADFSADRVYRYCLKIWWHEIGPLLTVIMLNPSTADEFKNDPTVERIERRARERGFAGITILNAFAFRATDPKVMKAAADPIGPENDDWIRVFVRQARISGHTVMVGWGAHGNHLRRSETIQAILDLECVEAVCLGTCANGEPKHPLYVPYEQPLVPWSPR